MSPEVKLMGGRGEGWGEEQLMRKAEEDMSSGVLWGSRTIPISECGEEVEWIVKMSQTKRNSADKIRQGVLTSAPVVSCPQASSGSPPGTVVANTGTFPGAGSDSPLHTARIQSEPILHPFLARPLSPVTLEYICASQDPGLWDSGI